ncbi:MAG: acyltransferase, partial [Bacteroidales bacterium]|nr:acyltransferase [Bacteroidales bacterium]
KFRVIYIKNIYKIKSKDLTCYFGYNLRIKKNSLSVGKKVYIGNNAHLSVDKIDIDDYTLLASNVSIVGGDHKFDIVGTPIINTGRDIRKGVKIGKDCWIGHGVIIFDGITINDGSIIGAGSIVTKSIPEYSISVGNPAKVIRKRFSDENIEKHKEAINKI